MEIGIGMFGDMATNLTTGEPMTAQKRLNELLEQIKLADQVGLDVYSIGEHHRPDYAVSSPEIVLAAAASITKNIKLSSGVSVLSSADPVKLYQDFSTVDLISNGRAEITLGRGSFIESFPLFGYSLDNYDKLFSEKLDLMLKLNENKPLTWKGELRAPLYKQEVWPHPVDNHLDMWIAVGGTPTSVERAARLGLPLMVAIIGGSLSQFKQLIQYYKDTYILNGHDPKKMQIGIHSHTFITETGKDIEEKFFPYYGAQMDRIGKDRGWRPYTEGQFHYSSTKDGAIFAGDPNEMADKILYAKEMFGLTRFLAQIDVGGAPHKDLMNMIELIGDKVAPQVR
ncbi:MAG: LLM class flavin-dependent oxidoreductase [Pseudopedobacter saltans]|uniref:LLM class flavin-dependent oxidoreductase n=1 Tax=Pseudopedobacter saltans TaxID=151895 RepID=A0A2W5F1S5_9SPHI|nr:MAG: LLM class flavin-dependent oxidoreductase [Pseudopedobacter saltans]